jgi:hypothetical protein
MRICTSIPCAPHIPFLILEAFKNVEADMIDILGAQDLCIPRQHLSKVIVIALVAVALLSAPEVTGQKNLSGPDPAREIGLPSVTAAAVPFYPSTARIARIEGIVHLKITTNGQNVIAVAIEDGNTILASAAESNVKTWEFNRHAPLTFGVTFTYKLVGELKGNSDGPTVTLRFPTAAEITDTAIRLSDPAPDPRPQR